MGNRWAFNVRVWWTLDDAVMRLLDVIGTVVFAISGATLGVRRRVDLFGVLVLACVTATAGGVMRDLLMGDTPPVAISDWKPLTIAAISGLVTFYFEPTIGKLRSPVQVFDAAGLAVFAVAGTEKALVHGIPIGSAVLLGLISAVGGGVVRDIMTAQVPSVLRSEIYAVAAIAASVIVVFAHLASWESPARVPIAVATGFLLRMIAIRRAWSLPTSPYAPKEPPPPPSSASG